ncbi:MAG: proteasome subunit alpha [Nitrospirales bacterium]|nr:MAG: proteasome subunit alpha [Nitrospirales bacterium]
MYEEPYRWIEAVANRRNYLDDQFTQGNPLVGVSFAQGILLLTFNRGTEKIYEIYDRIALGGMGHPADLEKLRYTLLDMAHVEGFQRSPADVTASRLMKNGLAPVIKQAFEEIFKAPYIAKILLAEVGATQDRDRLFTINYDGMFEEQREFGLLAASPSIRGCLTQVWKNHSPLSSLQSAVEVSLRLWGIASHLQTSTPTSDSEEEGGTSSPATSMSTIPDDEAIASRIRETLSKEAVECVFLDRESGKMETYRVLSQSELQSFIPSVFQPPT